MTAILVSAMVVLSACSGGTNGLGKIASEGTAGSQAAAAVSSAVAAATGGGSSAKSNPLSTASYRIANLYAPGGKPGPGLDIYDVQLNNLNGATPKPILTNVAYGTVSAYVHPHLLTTIGQKEVELEALPTGENPKTQSADGSSVGGLIDDGSAAQITELLSGGSDATAGSTSLIGSLSFSERVEKGDDGQGGKGPLAPTVTGGGGQILVDDTVVPSSGDNGLYLMIDSSCAPPLNGDPNEPGIPYIFAADGKAPVSSEAVFAASAGTHQVSVVDWASDEGPTCSQLTQLQATTSVTVADGQQILLFVYGTSFTDLHIALAPVAQ